MEMNFWKKGNCLFKMKKTIEVEATQKKVIG